MNTWPVRLQSSDLTVRPGVLPARGSPWGQAAQHSRSCGGRATLPGKVSLPEHLYPWTVPRQAELGGGPSGGPAGVLQAASCPRDSCLTLPMEAGAGPRQGLQGKPGGGGVLRAPPPTPGQLGREGRAFLSAAHSLRSSGCSPKPPNRLLDSGRRGWCFCSPVSGAKA